MAILKNRAGVVTATAGAGTITLGAAIAAGVSPFSASWQTFAGAGVVNGDSVRYLILDSNGAWEYGTGTYTAAGTTLSRAAGLMDGSVAGQKSSTGSLLALSGNAQVYVTAVAEDIIGFAPLASPVFTGDPQVPTPAAGDNDTSIANTAFVKNAAASAASAIISQPQGRLTPASGTPVVTTSVQGGTTTYYTPYVGQYAPLYNGTNFVMTDLGGELSQALADATKSPAAAAINSVYDYFIWDDAGTKRCTRGPPWTSITVRGTGVGTTELQRQNGIWLNKNAITNGPAALRGTYVGTIRTDNIAQLQYKFGSAAAGGGYGWIGVWNCYNRVNISISVMDSTTSWTYASPAYGFYNGNSNWTIGFVSGLAEDMWMARAEGQVAHSATGYALTAIGLDIVGDSNGFHVTPNQLSQIVNNIAELSGIALGFHQVNMCQYATAGTVTYYGSTTASHLTLNWRC